MAITRGTIAYTSADVTNNIDALGVASEVAASLATQAELDTHAAADLSTSVHGQLKVTVVDGTAAAANVTVTGMTASDTIIKVLAFVTKASIATMADRTSEYAAGSGVMTKAAGTDDSSNQLLVIWIDNS